MERRPEAKFRWFKFDRWIETADESRKLLFERIPNWSASRKTIRSYEFPSFRSELERDSYRYRPLCV